MIAVPNAKNENYRFLPPSEFGMDRSATVLRTTPIRGLSREADEKLLIQQNWGNSSFLVQGEVSENLVLKHQAKSPLVSQEYFSQWGFESSTHEFCIEVKKNQTLPPIRMTLVEPLELKEGQASHVTRLTLKAGSKSSWVIELTSEPGQNSLNRLAHILDIQVEEGAHADVYLVQALGLQAQFSLSTLVKLHAHSQLNLKTCHVGGFKGRHYIEVRTLGPHCRLDQWGVTRLGQSQKIDYWLDVEHSVPHTSSSMEYWTIVSDQASVNFNGGVRILQSAPHTEAFQKNKNLNLSRDARIESSPKLDIAVDEVKCAHGSSTSSVSPDQLFYLSSRGIEPTEARKMIVEGWTQPFLDALPIESAKTRLQERFRQ